MSNTSRFIVFLVTVFHSVSFAIAEDIGLNEGNPSIEIMAAYSVQYGVALCESEDDETKRTHVAKGIVSMIFYYWYSSRVEGGYTSSKIDAMMKLLPKNTYKNPDLGVLFNGCLRDPLSLLGDNEPFIVDPKYNISSKSEYLLLLKSFSAFFGENP